MGEGYRVTMPSEGSTENGYKASGVQSDCSGITIGLDCLLKVFTPIALRVMGFYLCLLEWYKVLREMHGGRRCSW